MWKSLGWPTTPRNLFACTAIGTLGALAASAVDEPPRNRVTLVEGDDEGRFVIEAADLDDRTLVRLRHLPPTAPEFGAFLAVRTSAAEAQADLPPISGRYTLSGRTVRFTPTYPLRRGTAYRVSISDITQGGQRLGNATTSRWTQEVLVPAAADAARPTPTVVRVDPTADRLPENQLRFYIHFDRPMARGASHRLVELQDAEGRRLEASFLELDEELWDPTGRRLTLLLDPGRVKQALRPREELGSVLHAGQTVRLVVKSGWSDAQGVPLPRGFVQTYSIGPAVSEPLNPREWKISVPTAGGQAPLVVEFPRPLDRALLERALRVVDDRDEPVPGSVEVVRQESEWRLTPRAAWKEGAYRLVVQSVLEDTAGNSVARAFEEVVPVPQSKISQGEHVSIPFQVVPSHAAR